MRPATPQKIIICSEFELYEQLKSYLSQLDNYVQKAQTPTVILGDCEISLSNVTIKHDMDLRLYYAKRLLRAGLHFSNVNKALGLSFVVLNRLIATHSIYYKRLKGKKTRFSYLRKNNTRIIRLQTSIFVRVLSKFLEKTNNDIQSFVVQSGDAIDLFICFLDYCNAYFVSFGMQPLDINIAFDSLGDVFGENPCLRFEYCMQSGVNFLYPIVEDDPKLKAWLINPIYKERRVD
jgi:hypothetical protein